VARKKRPGLTRIAVGLVDQQDRFTVEKNLASTCRLIEQAGRMGCDLFAGEEGGLSLFCGKAGRLDVPGPETRRIGALARKHRMYVAVGLIMKAGPDTAHNAQVLFGRDGKILGVYKKMLPTNGEILNGIVPGDEMPVFDLDFGRVACLICYDSQFPEIARLAGIQNVDLILFSHVGGAILGDVTGRAIAYDNTCWCVTVGRGCNAFADPRGRTVAQSNALGRLLVVDCDVTRLIVPTNSISALRPWRVHHLMERRPHICAPLLGPPVEVDCPALPLPVGNTMRPGENRLEFDLVNRSTRRQRGRLDVQFPLPLRILTDEHLAWYANRSLGETDWRPRPRRIAFDLKPGERKHCLVRYTVPADAEGFETIRLSGRTAGGEEILWQRQLARLPVPPTLRVPRVARQADVETRGVPVALDKQFVGGPAGSRTTLRLAHDGRNLLIHAVCMKYGPWRDASGASPDALSIPILAEPGTDRLFWCHVARTGQTSTQRREGGTPVKGRLPRWTAKVERGARKWTARLKFPFAEFEETGAPPKGAERHWRINFQREAVLPAAAQRERSMSEVVHPPAAGRGAPAKIAAEFAVWSVPYMRIDAIERLGTICFA